MQRLSTRFSIAALGWGIVCVASYFAGRAHNRDELLRTRLENTRLSERKSDATRAWRLKTEQLQLAEEEIDTAYRNAEVGRAIVVAVERGDRVTVIQNRQPATVRLFGIECPSVDNPIGKQAQQFTYQFSFGRFVELEYHNHGGLVSCTLSVYDRSLNETLLRMGYATCTEDASADLREIEAVARQNKQGVWGLSRTGPSSP